MNIRNNVQALDRALAWIRDRNPEPDTTHRAVIGQLEARRRYLEKANAPTQRLPTVR